MLRRGFIALALLHVCSGGDVDRHDPNALEQLKKVMPDYEKKAEEMAKEHGKEGVPNAVKYMDCRTVSIVAKLQSAKVLSAKTADAVAQRGAEEADMKGNDENFVLL